MGHRARTKQDKRMSLTAIRRHSLVKENPNRTASRAIRVRISPLCWRRLPQRGRPHSLDRSLALYDSLKDHPDDGIMVRTTASALSLSPRLRGEGPTLSLAALRLFRDTNGMGVHHIGRMNNRRNCRNCLLRYSGVTWPAGKAREPGSRPTV